MIKTNETGHMYSGSLIDVQPLYNMNAMRTGGRDYEREYARKVMVETIKELKDTVEHFEKQLSLTK